MKEFFRGDDVNCYSCPYGLNNNPKEESVWCDKVGGKTEWYGYCADALCSNKTQVKVSNKKKMNKYERDKKYKNHLRRLMNHRSGYPSPVTYVYLSGVFHLDHEKPKYCKRLYRTGFSSYHKQQSNKRIRRDKNTIYKGWQCHKIYDFWWELC